MAGNFPTAVNTSDLEANTSSVAPSSEQSSLPTIEPKAVIPVSFIDSRAHARVILRLQRKQPQTRQEHVIHLHADGTRTFVAACAIHASQHATTAFGGSLQSLAQRLQTMVKENEPLLEAMSKAACRLASSQSPSEAIRIGNLSSLPADYTHVVVCSEYVLDPKDDALYPSLILEFKLPGDISAPASPSKIASSSSKALSPVLTTLLPRELDSMRAAEFVLSSLSCIATLIDVSTSYDSRDEGLVLKGSILFQNDLSVAYWGRVPLNEDLRVWDMLSSLFDGDQEMIWAMLDHVGEQREQLKRNRGKCRQKMLMESATWRKVVEMPISFCASSRNRLKSSSANVTNSFCGTEKSSNEKDKEFPIASIPLSFSVQSHLGETSARASSSRASRGSNEGTPLPKSSSFRFPTAGLPSAAITSVGSSPIVSQVSLSGHNSNTFPPNSPTPQSPPSSAQQSIPGNKSLPADDALLASLQNIGFAVNPSRQMLSLLGGSAGPSESSPRQFLRQSTLDQPQSVLGASPVKRSLMATLSQKDTERQDEKKEAFGSAVALSSVATSSSKRNSIALTSPGVGEVLPSTSVLQLQSVMRTSSYKRLSNNPGESVPYLPLTEYSDSSVRASKRVTKINLPADSSLANMASPSAQSYSRQSSQMKRTAMSEQLHKVPSAGNMAIPVSPGAINSQSNASPKFGRSSLAPAASLQGNSPSGGPSPDASFREQPLIDKKNSSGIFFMSIDDEDDSGGRDAIRKIEHGLSGRLSGRPSLNNSLKVSDKSEGSLQRMTSTSQSNASQRNDSLPALHPIIVEEKSYGEKKARNTIDLWNGETSMERIRWHEVQAVPVQDPVTGKDAILLLQTDITTRAIMEQRMAALTESQLSMLEEMFPRHVLEFIMGAAPPEATLGDLAYQHDDVTILFMDIVGFTSMSKEVPPQSVMEFLNSLFSTFDLLLDDFNVYKVETAGDCYIVAGALMSNDDEGFMTIDMEGDARDGARNVILFAQAMLSHARTVCMPHNGQPTCVRVGVHTGSVVSGLIGSKLPKFSLFGDTMNTSSRMESTSQPGCIQISESTYAMLEEDQRSLFEATGGVEVKGKGLMPTYIYQPTEEALKLMDVPMRDDFSPDHHHHHRHHHHHESSTLTPWSGNPMDLTIIEEAADEESWAAGQRTQRPSATGSIAANERYPLERVISGKVSPSSSNPRTERRKSAVKHPWEMHEGATTSKPFLSGSLIHGDQVSSAGSKPGGSGDMPKLSPAPIAFLSQHASSLLLRSSTNAIPVGSGSSQSPETVSRSQLNLSRLHPSTSATPAHSMSMYSNSLSRMGSDVQDLLTNPSQHGPSQTGGSSRQSSSRKSPSNLITVPSTSPSKSTELSREASSSHSDTILDHPPLPPKLGQSASARQSHDISNFAYGLQSSELAKMYSSQRRKHPDHNQLNPTSQLAALFHGGPAARAAKKGGSRTSAPGTAPVSRDSSAPNSISNFSTVDNPQEGSSRKSGGAIEGGFNRTSWEALLRGRENEGHSKPPRSVKATSRDLPPFPRRGAQRKDVGLDPGPAAASSARRASWTEIISPRTSRTQDGIAKLKTTFLLMSEAKEMEQRKP